MSDEYVDPHMPKWQFAAAISALVGATLLVARFSEVMNARREESQKGGRSR